MSKITNMSAVALMLALCSTQVNAAKVADYQFDNNLSSSIAGAPDLVDLATGVYTTDTVFGDECTVFEFEDPSGFSLNTSGLISPTEYTFSAVFYFEDDYEYQRILAVKDLTEDDGFYAEEGFLTYYLESNQGGSQPVTAFEYLSVVFTRGADGIITGYKNGVESFSLDDEGSASIANNSMHFFRDESSEDPAGRVANIQLYDTALSAQEVAALDVSCTGGTGQSGVSVAIPVNNPTSLIVLILLLMTMGGVLLWRKEINH